MRRQMANMIIVVMGVLALPIHAALNVGVAQADITPSKRVPLIGNFSLRLSKEVETPLTAQAVALEREHGFGVRVSFFVNRRHIDIFGVYEPCFARYVILISCAICHIIIR